MVDGGRTLPSTVDDYSIPSDDSDEVTDPFISFSVGTTCRFCQNGTFGFR